MRTPDAASPERPHTEEELTYEHLRTPASALLLWYSMLRLWLLRLCTGPKQPARYDYGRERCPSHDARGFLQEVRRLRLAMGRASYVQGLEGENEVNGALVSKTTPVPTPPIPQARLPPVRRTAAALCNSDPDARSPPICRTLRTIPKSSALLALA